MNEDVLDHYTWATGDCFKCAGRGIPTARVGRITAQSGDTHPVRACRDCLRQMEAQRKRDAERRAEQYEPGRLGL
ncbi:hypothetical protein [Streptomyces albus]|uniref:hypothetical protein n=1 Tax=Streptomyces sp. NRRL F-5917 TaxID=1463873 RepID=UPI0004C068B7|nr:hypothetical protein [Streptomyces sp. NRRL F-5917]